MSTLADVGAALLAGLDRDPRMIDRLDRRTVDAVELYEASPAASDREERTS